MKIASKGSVRSTGAALRLNRQNLLTADYDDRFTRPRFNLGDDVFGVFGGERRNVRQV